MTVENAGLVTREEAGPMTRRTPGVSRGLYAAWIGSPDIQPEIADLAPGAELIRQLEETIARDAEVRKARKIQSPRC